MYKPYIIKPLNEQFPTAQNKFFIIFQMRTLNLMHFLIATTKYQMNIDRNEPHS